MLKRTIHLVLITLILLPILVLMMLSFGEQWIFPDVFPQNFNIKTWLKLFSSDSELTQSLALSILISLSVAFLSTFMAFVFSKVISTSKYKNQYIKIAYLPYILSPVVLGVLWHYFAVILKLNASFFGVVLAQFLICFPFGFIILSSFWTRHISDIQNLSFTLGSSSYFTFKRIIFPLAKPILGLCFFQCFLISWFDYGLTQLIGGGQIKTLTLSVFSFIKEANIFLAALASLLLLFPPLLLLFFNKKIMFKRSLINTQ
ncbi:MAG: ABC transporter permease [Psychroflexus sp.]|uniref:ABC transporter permease n=1 Tax=Psychroflexus sp. S27 TaxID=1982757 RepID=UPI000C29D052|nr:ABC transporter permease [Psychroflexus sp. S27]PJX22704.1 ABC transporter permease [Psychroflexus sp. S27]